MITKKKHYPHPVLESQFNKKDDDFNNSFFDVDINHELNEDQTLLRLEVNFELENDTLKTLINNKKAVFALLIICDSTFTRKAVHTHKYHDQFEFDLNTLNQTVVISPFIIADEDIDFYKNEDLIEPLKNYSFKVQRGDLLAIGMSYECYLEKDPLIEIGSIFEFNQTDKKSDHILSFNPNDQKIIIYLAPNLFDKLNSFSGIKVISPILISMFLVPAVIHSLETIVNLDEAELLIYKDYSWYRTLENKLIKNNLGEDLSEISEENVVDLAHKLMDNPFEKSLNSVEELIMGMEEEL